MLPTHKFCGVYPPFHRSPFSPFFFKRPGLGHPLASGLIYLLKDRIEKGGRVATFTFINIKAGFSLKGRLLRPISERHDVVNGKLSGLSRNHVLHIYRLRKPRRCPSRQGKASFKSQATSSLSPYLNILASLSKGGGHKGTFLYTQLNLPGEVDSLG